MAKGGGGHQVRAVRESGSQHGCEVPVANGELLRQIVIERNVVLVVIADGLVLGGILSAVIQLLGQVVHSHKAVAEKIRYGAVWVQEIRLAMGAEPGVVQIGLGASAGVVE